MNGGRVRRNGLAGGLAGDLAGTQVLEGTDQCCIQVLSSEHEVDGN